MLDIHNRNFRAAFFITFFVVTILSFFLYNIINNFVFSKQKNIILKRKNIDLKEKMLERSDMLFLNDYIDMGVYTEQKSMIISDLKEDYKKAVNICETALATKEKEFDPLDRLRFSLSVSNVTLSVRYIFLKSLKYIKTITNFLHSNVYKKKEDYFLVLNERLIDRKLENIFSSFKDSASNVLFNSFLFSIFNFIGFDMSKILVNRERLF